MSRSIPPFGPDDDVLDRLLRTPDDASRLRAVLSAAAADSAEPQPGEAAALAAYRELVQEPAGIPSLTRRRQARLAVAAISSVVVLVGSGVAAAAGGALPDGAQQVAKTVLGVVGVHVPGSTGSNEDGTDPASAASPTPSDDATPPAAPVQPDRPSTTPEPKAHPSTPPTPGNSGPSRHHGNPTPHATPHPTPHHGKPTAAPTTSHRQPPSPHARKFAALLKHATP